LVAIKCNNLEAEMKRIGVSRSEIAECIDVSYRTIHSRFNGESEWLYIECIKIRDKFFPKLELDYLFASEETGKENN